MGFLDPRAFEPVKLSDLAATNELVAMRKDDIEKLMEVGRERKLAVAVTLLVVTGDRAGTVEYNKPITNTALRRLLNDNRVGIGDIFAGRPAMKQTAGGNDAVVLDGCDSRDQQLAEQMWAEKVAARPETQEQWNDGAPLPDEPPEDDVPPEDDPGF